jgi:hypothetical protein
VGSFVWAELYELQKRSDDILSIVIDEALYNWAAAHAGYSGTYTRARDYGIAPDVKTVQLVGAPNEEECRMLARALVRFTGPCKTETSSQYHPTNEAAESRLGQTPGEAAVRSRSGNCTSVMPLPGIQVGLGDLTGRCTHLP